MELRVVACLAQGRRGLDARSAGTSVERFFLIEAGSKPATHLINLLHPQIGAHVKASRIIAPGGGINIANGCEGTDIYFLLVAAFVAASVAALVNGFAVEPASTVGIDGFATSSPVPSISRISPPSETS